MIFQLAFKVFSLKALQQGDGTCMHTYIHMYIYQKSREKVEIPNSGYQSPPFLHL